MINYLKSEIYRMSLMKSTYLLPITLLGFIFFMLGLTYFLALDNPNFPYNNARFIFTFTQSSIAVVLFILPFLVNNIFADEYENGTFKNCVAYGVDRKVLYLGKLILMVSYAVLVSAVILVLFILGTNILMESGTTYDIESQRLFIIAIFQSSPVFLAVLSFSHMLSFVTKKTSSHWVIYFLIIIAFPTVLARLQFGMDSRFVNLLFSLTPMNSLTTIATGPLMGVPLEYRYLSIAFLLYTIVNLFVGLKFFAKQDV